MNCHKSFNVTLHKFSIIIKNITFYIVKFYTKTFECAKITDFTKNMK